MLNSSVWRFDSDGYVSCRGWMRVAVAGSASSRLHRNKRYQEMKTPRGTWHGALAAVALLAGSSAWAGGPSGGGIPIGNGSLQVHVDPYSGSLLEIFLDGQHIQDGDLDWGFQVEDLVDTNANAHPGFDAFGVDVFQDGDSIVVLGTYQAYVSTKGVPNVVVDFARVYTVDPEDNGFRIETTIVNQSGAPVTLRYYDSIDPQMCSEDTFTDLEPGALPTDPDLAVAAGDCNLPAKKKKKKGKTVPLAGPAIVMGTADARAVLSAGFGEGQSDHYSNVYDGEHVNTNFDFPGDDEEAFDDPAITAIFQVDIPAGDCTAVALDFGLGEFETDARAAFAAIGNGAVAAEPATCELPVAPPLGALATGMYASTWPGPFYSVDTDTAATTFVSALDCPFFTSFKGGYGGCDVYDAEFDNGTGTALVVGPGSPYDSFYGGYDQEYAEVDVRDGSVVGGPTEFIFTEVVKGETLNYTFNEVTDIEQFGDQWVAGVAQYDVEVAGGNIQFANFEGSVLAPFDPTTGVVDLTSTFAAYEFEWIDAMEFDPATLRLYVVTEGSSNFKAAGASGSRSRADKGCCGPYYSNLYVFEEGSSTFVTSSLPGIGYGLELDGGGNLFYAAYDEGNTEKGFQQATYSLYRLDIESAKACKGVECLVVVPTFIGFTNIDASSLMWIEESSFGGDGDCACEPGGGPVDSVDGRACDDVGGANKDDFGRSVSACGDAALIGAPAADPLGLASAGRAYVMDYDGSTTWTISQVLADPSPTAGDAFGYSVAVSGDVAVVGEPFDDAAGFNAGAAHVFRRSFVPSRGVTAWTHEATLLGSDAGVSDRFGSSVAVCGDRIVVGAPYDMPLSRVGVAYVFEYVGGTKGANPWTETARLSPSDGSSFDFFGSSVAIDGDRIAVGAPGDDDNGSGSGSLYVFTLSGLAWVEAKGTASDAQAGDNLGASVDISGTTVAAGAFGEDDTATNSGAVYLFHCLSATAVTDVDRLKAAEPATATLLGSSVAIAPEPLLGKGRPSIGSGFLVAAGAPGDDQGATNAGATHVFAANPLAKGGVGFEIAKHVAAAPRAGDLNGTAVDLTGSTTLSGAPLGNRINSSTWEPGTAYFFPLFGGPPTR